MNARVPLSLAPDQPETSRAPHGECAAGGLVIGELLALTIEGVPLVTLPGDIPRAVAARSLVDLHRAHIGRHVALMFEANDRDRPVVMGLLNGEAAWPLEAPPAQVEIDADGRRMVLNAREQLVLRCGKASITLTRAGKVLIEGTYVVSRSSGVNRIDGGSIQLN